MCVCVWVRAYVRAWVGGWVCVCVCAAKGGAYAGRLLWTFLHSPSTVMLPASTSGYLAIGVHRHMLPAVHTGGPEVGYRRTAAKLRG